MIKIQPYGEDAALVSFERIIDLNISKQVIKLHRSLKEHSGIKYLIPAYNSLTIGFDHTHINYRGVEKLVYQNHENESNEEGLKATRSLKIPVCYENEFALDMSDVCKHTGLTSKEVIQLHTEKEYHVFMLGFLAGFAYMGKTAEALACPRKTTPRLEIHEGAVGIAGRQTGIYPTAAPGGWQIIGTTPLKMFNTAKEVPNLIEPGDKVEFYPVSVDEFKIIQLKIETQIYEPQILHG